MLADAPLVDRSPSGKPKRLAFGALAGWLERSPFRRSLDTAIDSRVRPE